jgi:murein DD-endopeptidase MepM/ murein hydrolase activator NlpD
MLPVRRAAAKRFVVLFSLIGLCVCGYLLVPDRTDGGEVPLQQLALPTAPAAYEEVERDAYGFSLSVYEVESYRVRSGDTYAGLLGAWGLEVQDRLAFQEALMEHPDAGLRAGRTIRLYREDGQLRRLAFDLDSERYVIADLKGDVRTFRRPSSIVQKTLDTAIDGSLYGTLTAEGAPAELALLLSQTFETKIDFYRLQPGDQLRVVYDERQIDGEAVGVTRVLAAEMAHDGMIYDGYWFEGEESIGYFNAKGESLNGGFLKSPVPFSRLSSGFTMRRFHPVQRRWKAHLGTDYAAPTGTPILAVGDGVVTHAAFTRGNGYYVKIRHNGTFQTQYLHMSRFASGIKPGTRVTQGQTIGYVGSTGLATGPHVCYRFWKNGVQVDHRKEAGPPPEPVADADREAFDQLVASLKPLLDGPPVTEQLVPSLFLFEAMAAPTSR